MFKKISKVLVSIIIVTLFLFSVSPSYIKGESIVTSNWDWKYYKVNDDHCWSGMWSGDGFPYHTDHLTISQDGKIVEFFGHQQFSFFECALTDPQERNSYVDTELFSFQVDESKATYHTMYGTGFVFNANFNESTSTIKKGYLVFYTTDSVDLYSIDNLKVPNEALSSRYGGPGKTDLDLDYLTLIKTVEKPQSKIHRISIRATQNNFVYIDNGQELFSSSLVPTNGYWFGPAVQWTRHNCSQESHIIFTDLTCGINPSKPIANFSYNTSYAELRTPVYVTDNSYDTNTPPRSLTYYWSVTKKGENGSPDQLLWDNKSTPFTGYNASGVGTYITTLKVENDLGYFSDSVSKTVVITSPPAIKVKPEQDTYSAGDTISFIASGWWNSTTSTNNLVLTNTVSPNLFNPQIELVGSRHISKTSGNLSVKVSIDYTDGSSFSSSVTVPPDGLTFKDEGNSDKEVKTITIQYNSIPVSGGVDNGYGIVYKYNTSTNLSDYYKAGSLPRKYTSSNAVVLTVEKYSANDKGETTYIEKTSSFKLVGIVDNNEAITSVPPCNTEFLISGKTSGGEVINTFVSVLNGTSDTVTLPLGQYSISEVKKFEKGFDPIPLISLVSDSFGLKINNDITIGNGGSINFVKKLQVSTIEVSKSSPKIGESLDKEFEVNLSGSPIVSEISVDIDLISDGIQKKYSCDGNENIKVPVGTYVIQEISHSNNVALSDISVSDSVVWDRLRNYTPSDDQIRPYANVIAENEKTVSVLLNYLTDKYVYSNSITFSADVVGTNGHSLSESDVHRVDVNPSDYSYPITLTNIETKQTYNGLAQIEKPVTFSFMSPGTYEVSCASNMFLSTKKLNEINNDGIVFSRSGNKFFVTVPNAPASAAVSNTQLIKEWRGYSNLSPANCVIPFETICHVGLSIDIKNQESEPLGGCSFEIVDENDSVIFFKNYAGKIKATSVADNESFSEFTTNKDGKVNIAQIPKGSYKLKFNFIPDNIYLTDSVNLCVDNSMNIGLSLKMLDLNKATTPTSILLSSISNTINVGETIYLENKISPNNAYKVVEYRSEDPNIASISKDGKVTGLSGGTTVIYATSKKDSTVSCSFPVTVLTGDEVSAIRIEKGTLNMAKGNTTTLNICCSPSTAQNYVVDWVSSDPSVVSVSNGKIKAIKNGIATITAKCGDLEANCTVTVGSDFVLPTKITLDKSRIELISNHSALAKDKIVAELFPQNVSDATIRYESSNPEIVSVDTEGNVSALKAGTAMITATTSNGLSASCAVSSQPIVENIKFNVDDVTMKMGDSFAITTYLSPSNVLNPELVWTSSNEGVATVTDGFVKLIQEGTATITAKAKYPNTADVEATCSITVTSNEIPPKIIDVSMSSDFSTLGFNEPIEVNVGSSTSFYAQVRPVIATSTKINWSYSIHDIISIEGFDSNYNESNAINKYKITALGSTGGSVEVTGAVEGYPSVTVSFTVNIIEPSSPISIVKSGQTQLVLNIDGSNALSVQVEPQSSYSKITEVLWDIYPDNSCVEMVQTDDVGKNVTFTATDIGFATITATAHFTTGPEQTSSFTIEVVAPSISSSFDGKSLNINTDDILLITGEEKPFAVEYNFSVGDTSGFDITPSSDNLILTEVVNTNSKKVVNIKGTAEGDYSIHIVPANANFTPFDIMVHVVDTIPEATSITLTETSVSLIVGDSISIHANIEPNTAKNNIITWTSSAPNVASVTDGKVIALSEGSAIITATVDNVSAQCSVDVTQ